MKILHLLQSPFFSGAENVVCQIMKLYSTDSRVHMIYVSPYGPIQDSIESNGFEYIGLKKLSIRNIRKVIKEQKPDIVHAHDITASILASIATLGTSVKVISHIHVNNKNMSYLNFKTFIYFLSCFLYKHIFWVSPSCYNSYYFKYFIKDKSTILCNVMNKNDIINRANKDLPDQKFDVIYVGRIVYQKDPQRLLDVFEQVIKHDNKLKIGIVGDGSMLDDIKKISVEKRIDKNICFLGYQSNPLIYLAYAKVMVMTSRYEGLPMTVLEALALGIPIVSTPVDGLLNVIDEGINGYLSDSNFQIAEYLHYCKCNELRIKVIL